MAIIEYLKVKTRNAIRAYKEERLLEWISMEVTRLTSRIFLLLPVKKNRIIYISFSGQQYSCNPKYLYEHIKKEYPEKYECIWVFQNPEKMQHYIGSDRAVERNTFAFYYYMATSGYIINNDDFFSGYQDRRRQVFLQSWHGGGAYKKVGNITLNRNFEIKKPYFAKIDFYISSSRKFTEVQSEAYLLPRDIFICTGMPRNTILLKDDPGVRGKVLDFFDVDDGSRLVLHAPTFRGLLDECHQGMNLDYMESVNYERLLQALNMRFLGDWKLMIRMHHSYRGQGFPDEDNDAINASDYPDMQELLATVDVLITDYSSSMWDFALTRKPAFLFAPDIDHYKAERGFFTDPESWPFPTARTNEELAQAIMNFDKDVHLKKVQRHLDDLGSYENENAARLVCDIVGIK